MNKDKTENFNYNSNDLEIIDPKDRNNQIIESDESQSVKISPDGINVKKSGNLVVGKLSLIMGPIKRRHERHYKENLWHLVADIALSLVIIALLVFLFFEKNVNTNKTVSLQINSDSQDVIVGQLKTFELDYKANDDLKDGSIKVVLPRGFILEGVSPSNLYNKEKNTFYLGALDSDTSGKIKIDGYATGNKEDHQMISFTFNCDKCGKNGILNSYFYNINKYFLNYNLELPDKIYFGGDFEGKILIKNNASRDLSNLVIDLGENLILKKTDLEIKDNKLLLEKISPKENKEIIFLASLRENKDLEIKSNINFDFIDSEFNLEEGAVTIPVKEPELKLDIVSDQKNIKDKEDINYKIIYKNKEINTIKDIAVTLTSANSAFSIFSVKSTGSVNNYYLDGNVIKIEDLSGNESGEITLDIKFDQRRIDSNQEVYLKAEIEYQIDEQKVKYNSYSSKNKVVSQVSALASAYYYSPQGDQLGVGPLPPAVDMATNYWVFLEFNNSGNKLRDFILTAELPDNVYFSENKRVLDGKLTYAEIGKRFIWEINEIDGGVNKYRADFEITLIPGQKDFGNVLELLNNIKFTAYDDFTEEEISGSLRNINTNLENDRLSSGKGKVTVIR
ncbi:hypothetical protein CVU82_01885 [Candidatus Falkowbacteria bacterium HGW-Falkowbacteria-1]|uniref:DUF11 domain-containing protein n=1 Tax=Candidatus Falkowbacteria bacterium HGW-Falkowbacteria-1 TaxID=2013768 RepID=A0A2N2E9F9_9BACT|nr:MAG: hypothetical protein CVU82_01885 [Candidatus Falkowbacteria bacterium HGW-Falkowbacteria-1]